VKLKLGKEKVQDLIFKHFFYPGLTQNPLSLALPQYFLESLSLHGHGLQLSLNFFLFSGSHLTHPSFTLGVRCRLSKPGLSAFPGIVWDPSSALLLLSLFANPLTVCLPTAIVFLFSFFFFSYFVRSTYLAANLLSLAFSFLPTTTTTTTTTTTYHHYGIQRTCGGERGKSLYAGLRTSFSIIPSESQKSIIIPDNPLSTTHRPFPPKGRNIKKIKKITRLHAFTYYYLAGEIFSFRALRRLGFFTILFFSFFFSFLTF